MDRVYVLDSLWNDYLLGFRVLQPDFLVTLGWKIPTCVALNMRQGVTASFYSCYHSTKLLPSSPSYNQRMATNCTSPLQGLKKRPLRCFPKFPADSTTPPWTLGRDLLWYPAHTLSSPVCRRFRSHGQLQTEWKCCCCLAAGDKRGLLCRRLLLCLLPCHFFWRNLSAAAVSQRISAKQAKIWI